VQPVPVQPVAVQPVLGEGLERGVLPAGPCGCPELLHGPMVREDSQAIRLLSEELTPIPRDIRDRAPA
jgi:hypothetical protein